MATTTIAIATDADDQHIQRDGPSGGVYPPSNAISRDTTQPSNGWLYGPSKIYTAGTTSYKVNVIVASFNTGVAIPAGSVRNSASLQLYVNLVSGSSEPYLTAEYYDWDGVSDSDWSADGNPANFPAGKTALGVSSATSLYTMFPSLPGIITLDLSNPSNIRVGSGVTKLRFHLHPSITMPSTAADFDIHIAPYEHATLQEMRLVVDYTPVALAAPTGLTAAVVGG